MSSLNGRLSVNGNDIEHGIRNLVSDLAADMRPKAAEKIDKPPQDLNGSHASKTELIAPCEPFTFAGDMANLYKELADKIDKAALAQLEEAHKTAAEAHSHADDLRAHARELYMRQAEVAKMAVVLDDIRVIKTFR